MLSLELHGHCPPPVDSKNLDVSDEEIGLFCYEMMENDEICFALSIQLQLAKEMDFTLGNFHLELRPDAELLQIKFWKMDSHLSESSDLVVSSENLRTHAQNLRNFEIRNEILGLTDAETNNSFREIVPGN